MLSEKTKYFKKLNDVNYNNVNVLNEINKARNKGLYNAVLTEYTKRQYWREDELGNEYLQEFNEVEILFTEEKSLITNMQSKGIIHGKKNTCTNEEKRKEFQRLNSISAKSRIRKTIKESGLGYHWTTTLNDLIEWKTDRKRVLYENMKFMQRLTYQLSKEISYVAVLEIHPERFEKTGLKIFHTHIALPFRIEYKDFWSAWNNKKCKDCELLDFNEDLKWEDKCGSCKYFKGIVYVKYNGDFDLGRTAGYFAKYISKGFEDEELNQRQFGQKRYLVSKGLSRPEKQYLLIEPEIREKIEKYSDNAPFYHKKINENTSWNCLNGAIYKGIIEKVI